MAGGPTRKSRMLAHALHAKGPAEQHVAEQAVLNRRAVHALREIFAHPGKEEACQAVDGGIRHAKGGVAGTDQLSGPIRDELEHRIHLTGCADRQDGSEESVEVGYPVVHDDPIQNDPSRPSCIYSLGWMPSA